jgi:hypothetical protein
MRADAKRRMLGLVVALLCCAIAGAAAIAMLPEPVQARMDALPAEVRQQLRDRSRWLEALSTEQRRQLEARIRAWDALPAAERARLREHWQAWLAMPSDRRALVRGARRNFAALPPEERQALRDAFAGLPADARRGWLMGPVLGSEWRALEPLFMQVPASERAPLLQVLHALPPGQVRDLATLAQRTPPQGREALRRELMVVPPADRAAWLRGRAAR